MRLEILMGTQKSHFAYRLAWENTSSERIPFLPLHRRDLVSAEQGNKTFIGGRINWKKFEVMGEVIVGIQKSQGMPYPIIARNDDIQRLILESRIIKDDDVSTNISLSSLHCLPFIHSIADVEYLWTALPGALHHPTILTAFYFAPNRELMHRCSNCTNGAYNWKHQAEVKLRQRRSLVGFNVDVMRYY